MDMANLSELDLQNLRHLIGGHYSLQDEGIRILCGGPQGKTVL